jgi:hypothetical protein
VAGSGTANGTAIDIYPCSGADNQLFGATLSP